MADDQAVNQSASPVTSSSTPQEGSGQATTRTTGNGIPIPEGISKSAFKRQLKKEEREAGKEARKDFIREKRAAQKERQKDKKKQERQLREQTGGDRPDKVHPFKARVVIDCGFDELMSDKEVNSMVQQIAFCYASNRRSSSPFHQLVFSGPSKVSPLTYAPPGVSWQPNQTAATEGYLQKLEEAKTSDKALDFNDSRVGKTRQSLQEGGWRRWTNVGIVDNGGIESLWSTTDEQEKTQNGEEEVEDSAETSANGSSSSNHQACSSSAKQTPETQARMKQRKRRGQRHKVASYDAVPTNLRKEDIIYLTADTEETLHELEEGKTYIIGGIVDRNRYKNLCVNKAKALGLKVGRLPIDPDNLTRRSAEGKEMSTRKVLTVNQVYDILLGWTEQFQRVREDGDGEKKKWKEPNWEDALEKGLPGRKFTDKKEKSQEGSVQPEGEEAGEAEAVTETSATKRPREGEDQAEGEASIAQQQDSEGARKEVKLNDS